MSDSPRGVDHVDSIDSNDDSPKQPEKKKSRRPANTAFRQQRLKAWQPILTPKTVLPLFFTIGIIFAPIGGLLYYANTKVKEIKIEYTTCAENAPAYDDGNGFKPIPSKYVSAAFKSSNTTDVQWAVENDVVVKLSTGAYTKTDRCYLQFNIPEDMGPPVLFYYYLSNFYQNHRRYVDSFDADQLKGKARTYSQIHDSKCTPLYGDNPDGGPKKPYYPCGLIANSIFNDTFDSPKLLNPAGESGSDPRTYEMTTKGIAWDSDKDLYGKSKYDKDDVLPPPNWHKAYPNGYNESLPDLENDEAFQVWMRTAALPEFSKLYQKNTSTAMEKGRYEVVIDNHFSVREYKGHKSIIISTRTVLGGRNPFLGIAYIAVGGICIILGAVFTVTHLFRPRKLGDHTYLSWNNAPAAKGTGSTGAAMATGRDIRPGDA